MVHAVAVSNPETQSSSKVEEGILAGWRGREWRSLAIPLALLGVLLLALYERIGLKLVRDWYNIPDYSHGLLIPFFVLFLIWDRRRALAHVPWKASWAGLGLIAFALLVLMTGVFGAALFLSRFSFVLLAAGILWTLFGMGW